MIVLGSLDVFENVPPPIIAAVIMASIFPAIVMLSQSCIRLLAASSNPFTMNGGGTTRSSAARW